MAQIGTINWRACSDCQHWTDDGCKFLTGKPFEAKVFVIEHLSIDTADETVTCDAWRQCDTRTKSDMLADKGDEEFHRLNEEPGGRERMRRRVEP
jgi:hypothetical protein